MLALGYRYDLEDRRYLRAEAHAFRFDLLSASHAVPKPFTHRNWDRTENQGQMGSCAGHAGRDGEKILNYMATGGEIADPSRMLCYLLGQKFCGTFGSDEGSTIAGVVHGAKSYGNCLEKYFPYPDRYSTEVPPLAIHMAGPHKLGCHVDVHSYDEAVRLLATRMFVILIGFGWTEAMARSRGTIEAEDVFGGWQLLGGHANCISGIGRRRDRQGRYYLDDHNSHGTQWGDGGWAEIAPECFDRWGRGEGQFPAEMIAISKFPPFEIYRRLDWIKENVL